MTRSQVESAVVEGGGKGKPNEGEKDKKKGIEQEREKRPTWGKRMDKARRRATKRPSKGMSVGDEEAPEETSGQWMTTKPLSRWGT